jgi:ferric-dicitrate binding protein FerR (iron transport regulator)
MTASGNIPTPAADSVGTLVHSAGPRALPDSERMERARKHLRAEWRAQLARRRRTKWLALLAAALACTAVGLWVTQSVAPGAGVQVASVTRVVGTVLVRSANDVEPLSEPRTLFAGDLLDGSGGGRVLLRWLRNADVRLDAGSAVRLTSPGELELVRGAVYIETLSHAGPVDISVTTPAGLVRHVGTRFEVRIADGNVRVRVRDGAAVFSGSAQRTLTIRAGEQLLVSNGKITVKPDVPPTHPSWAWIREVAPTLDIEGRSLFEVLDALGRESGLRIVYENVEVRARAQSIVLHGQLRDLSVQDTIKAVLIGSGLDFSLHPDRVEIHAPRTG